MTSKKKNGQKKWPNNAKLANSAGFVWKGVALEDISANAREVFCWVLRNTFTPSANNNWMHDEDFKTPI